MSAHEEVKSRRNVVPTTGSSTERETRGARRKRETRDKLLAAAFRLIAERGVDAVAINDITEAADVGFGSFYNYFPSKEAIHEAVFSAVFDEFGETLERLTKDSDDPAEIIAVRVRHTIVRAKREPLWGRFLLREGFTAQAILRGLSARLWRDIQTGVAQKRFDVADPLMAHLAAAGTVMSTVAAEAAWAEGSAAPLGRRGLGAKNLAERAAAAILRGLGVPPDQATEIAKRPLPGLGLEPTARRRDALLSAFSAPWRFNYSCRRLRRRDRDADARPSPGASSGAPPAGRA